MLIKCQLSAVKVLDIYGYGCKQSSIMNKNSIIVYTAYIAWSNQACLNFMLYIE